MRWTTVVRTMCEKLAERGFSPAEVDHIPGTVKATNAAKVVEEVGAVDVSYVYFVHPTTGDRQYWAMLIPSNGEDALSDWGVPEDDPAGFNAALEEACDALYPM